MATIQLHDLHFQPYITQEEIQQRVQAIGQQLQERYKGKKPIFLCVLNGSFIFAADLVRYCNINSEISFIRLSSYAGTSSTGAVTTLLGINQELKDRHVIIVEDIIDTGKTLFQFIPVLETHQPASVAICSLLLKPDAVEYDVKAEYIGFEIPSKFVVGYGLDYDGLGRNLPDIYQLTDKNS